MGAWPEVSLARVDVVTRRAVMRFDRALLCVPDLVDAVAAVETAVGVRSGYQPDAASFPADAEPLMLQAWALAADVMGGLSAANANRLVPLPSLPGSEAAAVVPVDSEPRLRLLLEIRFGPSTADLSLAVATRAIHGRGELDRPGRGRGRPAWRPLAHGRTGGSAAGRSKHLLDTRIPAGPPVLTPSR